MHVGNLSATAQAQIRSLLVLPDHVSNSIVQDRVLRALAFDGMRNRQNLVPDPHDATFEWFVYAGKSVQEEVQQAAREKFTSWLESGHGIFHISGKLGSGKSTLMKYLGEQAETSGHLKKWANGRKLVVAQFFFWRPGTDVQKSLTGLYRTLLLEVFKKCPELIPVVMLSFWQEAQSMPWQSNSDLEMKESTVKAAFNRLISAEMAKAFPNHCFCFFIDGLDEYEATTQTDHTDLAALLNGWAEAGLSSDSIKLCVSSREYNSFMNLFSDERRLRLHELTYSDMVACIRDKLDRISESSGFDQLVEEIVQKGQGIFQWVGIVVKNMRYEIDNGTTDAEEFRNLLKMLPSEMNDLYKHIFDSLRDTTRACRTLAMVSKVMETGLAAFSVEAYSFFHDYERDKHFITGNSFPGTTEPSRTKLGRTRLRGWCGGLLDTSTVTAVGGPETYGTHPYTTEVVQFTHRSVRDFLEFPDVQCKILKLLEGFDILDAISHMHLADLRMFGEKCLAFSNSYILIRERHKSGADVEPYGFLEAWDRFCPDDESLEPAPKHYDVFLKTDSGVYALASRGFWGPKWTDGNKRRARRWLKRPLHSSIFLGTSTYPLWKVKTAPTVTDSAEKMVFLATLIFDRRRIQTTTHEHEDFALLDFLFDKGLLCDPTNLGPCPPGSCRIEPDVNEMPVLNVWHHFLLFEWMYQHSERGADSDQLYEQPDARFGEMVTWFLKKGADPYFAATIRFYRRPYNEDELETVNARLRGRFRPLGTSRSPPVRQHSLRSFREITIHLQRRNNCGEIDEFVVKEEIPVRFTYRRRRRWKDHSSLQDWVQDLEMDSKAKTELLQLLERRTRGQITLHFWKDAHSAAYSLYRTASEKCQTTSWTLSSGYYHLVIPVLVPFLLALFVLVPLGRAFLLGGLGSL
ncbi:hypothetical protein QBC41DRAFT_96643 [Cercophora samala]|uniref:NACHT domain-containing protein n=1 Tax=Cercophora samala TaxID=330535 RepID=A0AA39ZGM9_9PEZI|nr:hypothetical protein QBC41DRAFT_96643 [Cercophora samala]